MPALISARFLLLSTNLTRKKVANRHRLASSAYELSGDTNIDDLEQPPNAKIANLSDFWAILGCDA